MVATTYGFRPSQVSQAERTARGKAMDGVWDFAQAHAPESVSCLRAMLERPDAPSFFRFDGAALLVKLDPSPVSKDLQVRLWSDALAEDVDQKEWVEILAARGAEGFDVSKAGRRWLTEPDRRYSLPDHGGFEVTAYERAVFLFGSMDEALARPTLIDIARGPQSAGRQNAVWLLLFQATGEARAALATVPTEGLPDEARTAIAKAIGLVPSADATPTPYHTIPIFTRAELLSAFAARARDERAAYDGWANNPRFADSGAQVLLPADEPQVRALRRRLVSRCNQHGIDDYIVLSGLIMAMQERARAVGTPATPAPIDRSIPSTSPALTALRIPPPELPAGVTWSVGDPTCVSREPLGFFAQPARAGLPKPRARQSMVMRRGDELIGSALLFEYRSGEVPKVRGVLDDLLWEHQRAPSALHPEKLAVAGNTLLILCFPGADPAIAWYENRLFEHDHARGTRTCPGVAAVQADREHLDREGAISQEEAVRKVMYRHEGALLECSAGAVLFGEMAASQSDWPRAEKAYRRALALDEKGDLLPEPEAPWSARNGLALAIALQGRSAESVPAFESALVAAVKSAIPKQVGSAQYNLACAYAEVARFSDAAKTLKRAIEIDAQYEAKARTDNSFRRALGQPQFKWLSE